MLSWSVLRANGLCSATVDGCLFCSHANTPVSSAFPLQPRVYSRPKPKKRTRNVKTDQRPLSYFFTLATLPRGFPGQFWALIPTIQSRPTKRAEKGPWQIGEGKFGRKASAFLVFLLFLFFFYKTPIRPLSLTDLFLFIPLVSFWNVACALNPPFDSTLIECHPVSCLQPCDLHPTQIISLFFFFSHNLLHNGQR